MIHNGNALSKTADKSSSTDLIEQVLEKAAYIRPNYSAGGAGGAACVIRMMVATSTRW